MPLIQGGVQRAAAPNARPHLREVGRVHKGVDHAPRVQARADWRERALPFQAGSGGGDQTEYGDNETSDVRRTTRRVY